LVFARARETRRGGAIARSHSPNRHFGTPQPGEGLVPFPETPKLVDAGIATHPSGGRDCLLATTEDGQRLASGFETEGYRPGLQIVDPRLWLEAASEPTDSPQVFDSIEEINADDWLQAVVTNPAGNEWLERIKQAHPAAFETWFTQRSTRPGANKAPAAHCRQSIVPRRVAHS
jgi:hypothetical protein